MIRYLLGVDGGGSGTRVRLARADGTELAHGRSGPSSLGRGTPCAWAAIEAAVAQAFQRVAVARPPHSLLAIGLGLAGAHNKAWAADLLAAQPGYAAIAVETDAYTTWLGAHQGRPGAVVAVGTGSVGLAVWPGGERRDVGGWGFPADDEGSGAWLGLRAIHHALLVEDGRRPPDAFAHAVIAACGGGPGGGRDGLLAWLARASPTRYAELAPLVAAHGPTDTSARGLLVQASEQIAGIARALDPAGELPMALCGGLIPPLRPYLPAALLARSVAARGDSASGALRLIVRVLQAR